ncbi:MAG: hypothetical protein CVU59_07760 [Deltaproteobacteria bacterium HGW-Deltaproteobacteria-17]|nr:MAG: hypothetical protein CVU59_07760 [Deltaproteobacteria bacterium HGW-Deltaproteobacteria-17]
MTPTVTVTATLPVFFGAVILEWDDEGLISCRLETDTTLPHAVIPRSQAGRRTLANDRLLGRATAWLRDWEARRFRPVDFPIRLGLVTPFQQEVLAAIARIEPGTTATYAEVARRVGRPQGARSVGQVMARNPWPLFFPCHRVVGTSGLGGFGPGLDLKRRLLTHEGVVYII